jgi:phosphate transport system substrate-binding protein
VFTALFVCVTSCGKKETVFVKIDGSSTVFPVSEAVAEEFQKSKGGKVKVTVGLSGTGGGFKKFCNGETDVSNASRPILKEEMELAKKNGIEFIELPICFDALTVAVNPKNDWCPSMTVPELKKLWEKSAEGKITRWSQVREGWPDEKILLYGADTDSGTFDYFTEAINGKAKSSRADYTPSADDNTLVQGIEGNKYALGYIPFAYYEPHSSKLKAVAIQWDKNKVPEPVLPSTDAVLKGTYNPLSRPLFIYVNKKAAERPEVKEFVEFYMTQGPKLVREIKYLPLPDAAYKMSLERFQKRETGSAFGGVPEVGVPVEDMLRRQPKH